MNRLPTPGGDNGNWGQILNDYLSVEHNPDGSLKVRSEGLPATIADGSITASKLSSSLNSMVANAQTAVQSVNGKTGQAVTLAAADISGVVQTSQLGAASGVATLDGSSKLTAAQLPSSVVTESVSDPPANGQILAASASGAVGVDAASIAGVTTDDLDTLSNQLQNQIAEVASVSGVVAVVFAGSWPARPSTADLAIYIGPASERSAITDQQAPDLFVGTS